MEIYERWAREFHDTYERLAPEHGYKTREASAVPWEDVPEQNKALMVATVSHVMRGAVEALNEAREALDRAWSLDNSEADPAKIDVGDALDRAIALLGGQCSSVASPSSQLSSEEDR